MYLPSAPTLAEKYVYEKSGRYQLYLLSTITTLVLILGMVLFVLVNPWFIPYTVFVGITAAYLFLSYGIGLLAKDFDHRKHNKLVVKWLDRASAEEVDVFLPICGEPIEVIKNTWEYVNDLRFSKEFVGGKINVHVLDDGKSPEAKALAEKFKFNYITRETNELKKAGNLRNAFKLTKAPFIVILDADFCPRKDFLIETLPYMYENENLSIVQTPQFFETKDPSLNVIERGSAQIQELFYRLIQVSRNHFGGAICVGTSALYRRSHLEPHGGTAKIGWSEDVHTAVLIMKDGHEVQYIPLVVTKGQCPDKWKQFFTQFYRWSTGSLSLMLDKSFWNSRLSLAQKLCFSTGFGFYVTTGMAAALAFVPSIYLLIFKPQYLLWFNILWSIPSLLLTNIYLRYWQKTGYSWAAVECRAVSGYAHLFALIDLLMKRTEAWVPTGGQGKSNRYELFLKLVFWHNILLFLTLVFLIDWRFKEIEFINFIPLLTLFFYHLMTLKSVLREPFK
jgi:cellulose synthase/poly-beta-1,6-N-acetylglucosamine synthase-like glycosyltransferase